MKVSLLPIALSLAFLSYAYALPPCSITYCGTNGSLAKCFSTGTISGPVLCYSWAITPEAKLECRTLKCTGSCYFIPVYGSDGNPYCTPCHLHKKSCEVRFEIYGPVDGPVPVAAVPSAAPARFAVAGPSEVTHEARSLEKETVHMEEAVPFPPCSMKFCSLKGAAQKCLFQDGVSNTLITCGKFAGTPSSKEQCSFACIQICLPEDEQPVASNGEKFCSVCHLQLASCESGYKIFGPVEDGGEDEKCSMGLCTSKGAGTGCTYKGSKITCGKWAGTEEKEKECGFFCPLFCLPEDERPVDNTGKKHCSGCQLASASCGADFAFWGPV